MSIKLAELKKILKESLATLEKKFPGISKSDLERIWEADPSSNNHWSKKIAQFYSEGQVGLDPILITIERYYNLIQRAKGARVQVKDINSFSTYSTFDNYVNQLEAQVKKKAERFKKKQAYEIVYEDSTWYVLYPKDYDTLATLGTDSDWCVAKSKFNYNSYKKNGEFLIFIDKKLFKEYKEDSTSKEDRDPSYKWLFYGRLTRVIKVKKETLSIHKKELTNLENQHKDNKEINKIVSNLDLNLIKIDLNLIKIDIKYYNSKKQLHRDDGPAVEYAEGKKEWYKNGDLHREDGPAIEYVDGRGLWYQDGKYHREDGPAIERPDGTKSWWKDGKLHRDNGPAVEYINGIKQWYKNGELSRKNGPAVEYPSGKKEWYKDGKLHRKDGPARVYPDGTKEWYLDNKGYLEKDWKAELVKRKLEKSLKDE